jgi:hypothetical protein
MDSRYHHTGRAYRYRSYGFAMSTTSQDIRHKSNFIASSVADPKLYFSDPYPNPDPNFQLVSDPDLVSVLPEYFLIFPSCKQCCGSVTF